MAIEQVLLPREGQAADDLDVADEGLAGAGDLGPDAVALAGVV
jgi:hypothetical protein